MATFQKRHRYAMADYLSNLMKAHVLVSAFFRDVTRKLIGSEECMRKVYLMSTISYTASF